MDVSTVDFLRQVNNRFYERCAASFSATRNAPWHGWERCLQAAQDAGAFDGPGNGRAVRVLDVACGNMRFADFLREWFDDRAVEYCGVDHCDGLVPDIVVAPNFEPHFQNVDIIGELIGDGSACGLLGASDCLPCDFVGCFGFLHHVPSFDLRVRMLRALVEKAAPGGVACVSFWRFMGDAKFAKKAQARHDAALEDLGAGGFDASWLEPGDYFLGWQNEPGLWRYCHNFDEAEVDALVAAACADGSAEETARFSADGKSGAMNRYVMLRKA